MYKSLVITRKIILSLKCIELSFTNAGILHVNIEVPFAADTLDITINDGKKQTKRQSVGHGFIGTAVDFYGIINAHFDQPFYDSFVTRFTSCFIFHFRRSDRCIMHLHQNDTKIDNLQAETRRIRFSARHS